jgi:hypothetical protein
MAVRRRRSIQLFWSIALSLPAQRIITHAYSYLCYRLYVLRPGVSREAVGVGVYTHSARLVTERHQRGIVGIGRALLASLAVALRLYTCKCRATL